MDEGPLNKGAGDWNFYDFRFRQEREYTHCSRWGPTSKLKPTMGWGDRVRPFGKTNRNPPQSRRGTVLTSTTGAHGANVTSAPMTTDASSVARSTQGTSGAIEAPKHKPGSSTTVPPTQTPQQLPTPVRVEPLSKLLEGYHDAEYLVQGFSCSFKIDFEGPDVPFSAHSSSSAQHHSGVVSYKLTKEIELGCISGPLQEVPFKNFKCSLLSVCEKQTPGTYRLLHNLSYPYDESAVNFNVPKEASHVQYASIDDAFQLIHDHSPGAFMAKSDIKDAFRRILIHPSDYNLMGFMWQNQYYYDKCLPMCCSASCKIFQRFSSAVLWILKEKLGVTHVTKILDDFFFTAPSYASCLHSLHTLRVLCDQLGIPLAEEKTFLWETPYVFLHVNIQLAPRFSFSYPNFIHPYRCLLSRPIMSLELWPIRPFPSPDFIEDGSIRISSANLNSTWLIIFYPPNPSLVGIILAFNIRRFQAAQNGIILGFHN